MDRKEKVKLIEEHFGVSAKYLGVPSLNYEIQTSNETYIVDRQGNIFTSRAQEITLEDILNSDEVHKNSEYETIEIGLPLKGHTVISLTNIINMLSSKQHLIMSAFKTNVYFMDETFAKDLSEKEINTIEDFKTAFTLERCPGLVIDFEQERITFKLKAEGLTRDKMDAFKELSYLINTYAKRLKRSSFKKSQDDNPKYAFRTWLIRLGMKGSDYRTIRKVLLSNLEGSGAFRKVCGNEEKYHPKWKNLKNKHSKERKNSRSMNYRPKERHYKLV